MKTRLLLSLLLISQYLVAQNFQTVEDVNDVCSTLGFSTNEDAEIAVDRILDQVGLQRNFIIVECPNINNAVAKNIEMEDGLKARYILYDSDFFNRFNSTTSNDWPALSILAHEIGHHLNGHALNNLGSNHKFELEADEFSGFVLGKMGARLDQAQSAISALRYTKATSTHPAKADRLISIEKGWIRAGNNQSIIDDNNVNAKSEALYTEGLKFYNKKEYIDALFKFKEAGEKGHVMAQSYCGFMFKTGKGINKDFKKALKWYKKAAEANDSYSQNNLGTMYRKGEGVPVDNFSAFYWYKKAAEKGYTDAESNLGYMYDLGLGASQDYIKAEYWYKKAANKGNVSSLHNLGLIHKVGKGTFSTDYITAMYWFKKAAEKGYRNSMYQIGLFYQNGLGVTKNDYSAFSWFKKAADKDHDFAQSNVGWMCLEGKGVIKNYENALYWLKKAADAGVPAAQVNLGYMYDTAKGTAEDDNKAVYWYRKAAKQGNKTAQKNLEILGKTW